MKTYRHELKYIINSGYHQVLRQRLKAAMKPDAHGDNGVYRITSLYFDDVFRSAYNDKALGLDVRKKYRIRYYGLSHDFIRLEVKEKKGDMVCKRSSPISYEQYQGILRGERGVLRQPDSTGDTAASTAAEEFYASDRLVRLTPAVLVDYVREAYVCPAGNVRITFDMQLQTSPQLDPLGSKTVFHNVFDSGEIILEVKYDRFIPAHIQALLGGIPMTRESVSKFVLCSDKTLEVAKCNFWQAM